MNQKDLFAERLRSAMEQKQMKQVDLVHAADEAGLKVGKSHISQYVSAKTLPRADILHFLAQTLDVDEAWLMVKIIKRHLLFLLPLKPARLLSADLISPASLIMFYMMCVVLSLMRRIVWNVTERIS